MAAEQRKLLEQLMGDQLMAGPGTARAPTLTITDPKVCRSFLCGGCPHDLFTNTKQDLGACPLTHQPNLKEDYANATAAQRAEWGFEFDWQRDMGKYVGDCDRRIDSAQRRLEKTPEEIRQHNALLAEINALSKTIEAGLIEIEALCETKAVNLAVQEYHLLRHRKALKEERERDLRNLGETSGPSGHQKLQVCDVCGAYLSRLDNDRRLADHFFGKMHLGYAFMRKELARLKEELKGRQPPRREEDERGGYDDRGYGGRQAGGGFGGGGYGGRGGGGYGGGGGGYGGGGGGYGGRRDGGGGGYRGGRR